MSYTLPMDLVLTLPSALLFVVSALAMALSVLLWVRRRSPGGIYLFWLLVAVAFHALAAALEAAATPLSWKIIWSTMEYAGSGPAATLFFTFSAAHTGHHRWMHGPRALALWAVPLVAFGLVATNAYHGWVWEGFARGGTGSNAIVYHHGPAFYAILLAFFTYVLVGCGFLIRSATRPVVIRRRQSRIVLLGAVFPILAGLLYALRLSPVEGLNLIPVSLLFTVSLLLLGTGWRGIFNLVPVARDTLIEEMGDAIIVLDKTLSIVDLNPAGRVLLGIDERAIGRRITAVASIGERIVQLCSRQGRQQTEILLRLDPPLYVDLHVSPLSGPSGDTSGHLLTLRDITKRWVIETELQRSNERLQAKVEEVQRLHRSLREQAISDALTGLFNRGHLDEILPRELDRAAHAGEPVSILLIDIDRFKTVNDRFGHQTGDRLLQRFARLLGEKTRARDSVSRYGGEEFVVLLPRTPTKTALERAEEIRVAFRHLLPHLVPHRDDGITVSLSAGVASFPTHAVSAEELIRCADQAMYKAKRAGGDRVISAPVRREGAACSGGHPATS